VINNKTPNIAKIRRICCAINFSLQTYSDGLSNSLLYRQLVLKLEGTGYLASIAAQTHRATLIDTGDQQNQIASLSDPY
jgi:hypothetical protein